MNLLYIVLGCLLLAIFYTVSVSNKLVRLRNQMQEAWSGIDVYLKKRHDLVPNLVSAVKGYAAHEKQTFEEVIRLRAQAIQASRQDVRIASEGELGQALGRLMAISESYPALKANANFLELQRQLAALEEELSLSRRYYNGTVRELNIVIESFPSNLIAGLFSFEKGVFFEIKTSEREVPKVSFVN